MSLFATSLSTWRPSPRSTPIIYPPLTRDSTWSKVNGLPPITTWISLILSEVEQWSRFRIHRWAKLNHSLKVCNNAPRQVYITHSRTRRDISCLAKLTGSLSSACMTLKSSTSSWRVFSVAHLRVELKLSRNFKSPLISMKTSVATVFDSWLTPSDSLVITLVSSTLLTDGHSDPLVWSLLSTSQLRFQFSRWWVHSTWVTSLWSREIQEPL